MMATQLQDQSTAQFDWLTMDRWQSFVEHHPETSVFHLQNWLKLLANQYGMQISIPALCRGDEILAAIPFLETRSLNGSRKLISLPFTDYVQVLGTDDQWIDELSKQISNQINETGKRFQAVVVRSDRKLPSAHCLSPVVRHQLATNRSMGEIESGFNSAIRRNLNKSRRSKLEFQSRRDSEAMDMFYRLHVLTRKKLGVPVQSRRYFQRVEDKLLKQGLGFVSLVMKDNRPLAAGVMLGFNKRLIYKYAASDPQGLEFRPNECLVYNSILHAVDNGYDYFDFGISDKQQEGLRRFKSKWGATESEIYYNYLMGEPQQAKEDSRAMKIAGEIIKRSPVFVCRGLGKLFYRYSQ